MKTITRIFLTVSWTAVLFGFMLEADARIFREVLPKKKARKK